MSGKGPEKNKAKKSKGKNRNQDRDNRRMRIPARGSFSLPSTERDIHPYHGAFKQRPSTIKPQSVQLSEKNLEMAASSSSSIFSFFEISPTTSWPTYTSNTKRFHYKGFFEISPTTSPPTHTSKTKRFHYKESSEDDSEWQTEDSPEQMRSAALLHSYEDAIPHPDHFRDTSSGSLVLSPKASTPIDSLKKRPLNFKRISAITKPSSSRSLFQIQSKKSKDERSTLRSQLQHYQSQRKESEDERRTLRSQLQHSQSQTKESEAESSFEIGPITSPPTYPSKTKRFGYKGSATVSKARSRKEDEDESSIAHSHPLPSPLKISLERIDDVESFEPIDNVESFEPIDNVESFEPIDNDESFEPIDNVESFEPIDNVEYFEPIDNVESFEPIDNVESFERIDEEDKIGAINATSLKTRQTEEMKEEKPSKRRRKYGGRRMRFSKPPSKKPVQRLRKPSNEPVDSRQGDRSKEAHQISSKSTRKQSKDLEVERDKKEAEVRDLLLNYASSSRSIPLLKPVFLPGVPIDDITLLILREKKFPPVE